MVRVPLSAAHTERQALQKKRPVGQLRERVVKSVMNQRIFELQNSFSGAQSRFQFLWIAGLDEIVVGAGRQTSGNFLFGAFRSKKNYVNVRVFGTAADLAQTLSPSSSGMSQS